jgi:cobalt/nickel transport system ATP-binding protein
VTPPPVLEVRGLTFAYAQGPPALNGVTFSIAEGERVALVGPNGAGKTSLFLCLCGVLNPQGGNAVVAGLDVRDSAQRRRLPGQVGIVFQNPDDQLFSTTVLDDVAFGPLNQGLPSDEVRVRADEALARVGLAGVEDRVPWHLSGGEKRRVALAGVLAMRPRVLLLDEPSMFLDPRGRRGLIELLNALGGTQVLASHDLEMVLRTCARVLLLDAGRLVVDGPARAVLGDAALMEAHGLEVPASLASGT